MPASQALNETRLPRAVRARSAAIAARYAPPAETEPPTPAAAAAPALPPAAPAATPTDTPPAPAADPRHSDPNYWKQRFEVTSGILSKERAARQADNSELNRRITELQDQTRTLQAAAPAAEIDLTKYFTPAQIETYGEEQCRVMAQTADKAATTKAQELIDAAVQPLKDERKRNAETAAEERKAAFVDTLTELVPDWRVIDTDQRWLDWLGEEDENEVKRQSILDQHIGSGNARAAAKLFQKFVKTVEVPAPPVGASGSGANPGGDATPPTPEAVRGLTPLTAAEKRDFFKRSATVRKGQPGFVTDEERATFEARLKLEHPARG